MTSSDCERELQCIMNDFLQDSMDTQVDMYVYLLGCWPRETSYLHDNTSSDNVVHGPVVKHLLDIEVKVVLVGADCSYQLCDVVGVQSAGLCRQTAGQVCVANMGHSLKITNKKDRLH